MDERRGKPGAHAGRRRGQCVLRQPRHVGDAFRRRARPGRRDALRAGPVRGGRHRRRRRLLPDERGAGGDPAASRARLRQRRRQHPQRQQGGVGHGQHRRRPRDLSPAIRRAADLRHRGAGDAQFALGQDLAQRDVDRRRRRRGDRGGAHAAGPDRDPDPAGRHGVERRLRARSRCRRRRRAAPAAPEAIDEAARVLRSGEPTLLLLTGRALREDGLALAGKICRQDRRQADRAGLERAHAARRGAGGARARALCRRPGARRAEGAEAHHPRRREDAGRVLRLSQQAEPAVARGLPGPCAVHSSRRIRSARSRRWPRRSARSRTPAPVVDEPRPELPTGSIEPMALGAVARRAAAGERDRRRRGGDDRARLLRADQGGGAA